MRASSSLTTLAAALLISGLASANPIVIDPIPGPSSNPRSRSFVAGPSDACLITSDNLGDALRRGRSR
jgi:hypothetical protein